MTLKELQKLIELGILTPDCGPSTTSEKLSPELKRDARRRMKGRERMTSGLLLSRILARLRREEQDDRKEEATIIDRVGNMEAGA
jgi:hypothetical protein